MLCLNCKFDNPEEMKFCGQCGEALKIKCLDCNFENPPNFKFCGNCRTPLLLPSTESITKSIDNNYPSTAQRRYMTVMFIDLVGSVQMSEKLEIENYRKIILKYQNACSKPIENYDGYIAKYIGDGLLVYYGYPIAHENDAYRAVMTGLGILSNIEQLNQELSCENNLRLAVRIGIHTGLVVAGEMGAGKSREALAIVGITPNIAARIESICPENSLLVSSVTYKLTKQCFTATILGAKTVKGISTPIDVYQILNINKKYSYIKENLTPLVGREQEMVFMYDQWNKVKEGMGHVISITGEAGIGKTRLIYETRALLDAEKKEWNTFHCSEFYITSPFYPIITFLELWLDFRNDDSNEVKLNKLTKLLEGRGVCLPEDFSIIASLLSLESLELISTPNLSPQKKRSRTLEVLQYIFVKVAEKSPQVMVFENLQWADSSTLEFIELFINQVRANPALVIFSSRPEFSPPWSDRSFIKTVSLSLLSQNHVKEMVNHLANKIELPDGLGKKINSKSDGIPLYIEEITKMVLELCCVKDDCGNEVFTKDISSISVPDTLKESFNAQLDKLNTVKEIIQIASVFGREFNYKVMEGMPGIDKETLQHDLNLLVEKEFFYQKGIMPEANFHFRHALIRDAAYDSLLIERRKGLHKNIAYYLVHEYKEISKKHPEIIGHHYSESGQYLEASRYWLKAGLLAAQNSAYSEAIQILTQGLDVIKNFSNIEEQSKQELQIRTTMGMPLMAVKGYSSEEVAYNFTRVHFLCKKEGNNKAFFQASFGIWMYSLARGEIRKALALAEDMLRYSKKEGNRQALMIAHRVYGTTNFFYGDSVTANEHVENALALYDRARDGILAYHYGQDMGVASYVSLSWSQWMLGSIDESINSIEQAVVIGESLGHPMSYAFALLMDAMLHQFNGDSIDLRKSIEKAIEISQDQKFPLLLAWATVLNGWCLAKDGKVKEGIKVIEETITFTSAMGAKLFTPYFLCLLAEVYEMSNLYHQSTRVLTKALNHIKETGECFWESELYRQLGEIQLKQGKEPSICKENLLQAASLAKSRGMKTLEIRAKQSLEMLLES